MENNKDSDFKRGINFDPQIEIVESENRIKILKDRRKLMYIVTFTLIFSAITLILFSHSIIKILDLDITSSYLSLIGAGISVYSILLGISTSVIKTSQIGSLEGDVNILRAKQEIISRPSLDNMNNSEISYFDRLVEINITNLEAYYRLVKEHTNNSFFASITAGGIGFLFIVTGLIIGFIDIEQSKYIAYVSTACGVLTEFIAGVFFYLYSKTVRQLKDYHDSLVEVQNILLSFKIVGDTEDKDKQASLMELMLKCLIKIPSKKI